MSNFSNSSFQKRQFFFQSDKKQSLIDYLTKEIQANNSYHLILVSCYLNLDSVDKLIELLKRLVNLTKISIYVDRGTAIKIGKKDISDRINKISQNLGFKINFKIAKTANLFHAKAYCLLADDNSNGSLVLGSANLTDNGLIGGYGNIELLHPIYNIEDVLDFYNELTSSRLKFINLSQLEEFDDTDNYYFKYALLQEGCFVQINKITINNLLNFKYKFNEKGRKESNSKELKDLGLEGQNSYNANYFQDIKDDIDKICLKYNPSFKIDWGDYGINTAFGCWIPKHIGSYLLTNNKETLINIKSCKNEIQDILYKHLPTAANNLQKIWNSLLEKDWLIDEDKHPLTLTQAEFYLKEKIDKLLINLDKCLLRYYILDFFDFNFNNPTEIEFFFHNLQDSCAGKEPGKEHSFNYQSEYVGLTFGNDNEESQYKSIFNSYMNESYLLLKLLSRAIESKKLGFIKYLDRDFFIRYINNRQTKSK